MTYIKFFFRKKENNDHIVHIKNFKIDGVYEQETILSLKPPRSWQLYDNVDTNTEILNLEGPFTSRQLWEGVDIKLPDNIEIKATVTTGSTVKSDGIIIIGDGNHEGIGGNIYLWFGSNGNLYFGVQSNGNSSDGPLEFESIETNTTYDIIARYYNGIATIIVTSNTGGVTNTVSAPKKFIYEKNAKKYKIGGGATWSGSDSESYEFGMIKNVIISEQFFFKFISPFF